MQVLPLAFALAWNPPDPKSLLDFLLLPVSPLPRWAANRLATSVAETPGVGGPLWQEAFEEIAKRFAEKSPDEPEKKRAQPLPVGAPLSNRNVTIPLSACPASPRAGSRPCRRLGAARYGATEDGLFLALATAASDLGAAIDATEAEHSTAC